MFRQADALQQAKALTTVMLDKTGTLTKGHPVVTGVYPRDTYDGTTLLSLAASLAQGSEHPLAEAILVAAKTKSASLQPVVNFKAIAGHGVGGTIQKQWLRSIIDCTYHLVVLVQYARCYES